MSARRTSVLAVAVALLAGGCGQGGDRTPSLAGLPLVGGARITVRARTCNAGANAYCAVDFVVTSADFTSSEEFLLRERADLRRLDWSEALAPNGQEHAVDSPGGGEHLTYATAPADLEGIDLGWIQRAHAVALGLSQAYFAHTPALSMELRFGAS